MRNSTVFADSFLDGFTMAEFLNRLYRPGSATALFAPAPERSQMDDEPLISPQTPTQPGEEGKMKTQVDPVSGLSGSVEVWVGRVEVRQLTGSDHRIELSGKGAFTWVTCWARDVSGYEAKVSAVMTCYGLFIVQCDNVMTFSKAENLGLVGDELLEQFSDTVRDQEFCIYGTFHNYLSDN